MYDNDSHMATNYDNVQKYLVTEILKVNMLQVVELPTDI